MLAIISWTIVITVHTIDVQYVNQYDKEKKLTTFVIIRRPRSLWWTCRTTVPRFRGLTSPPNMSMIV